MRVRLKLDFPGIAVLGRQQPRRCESHAKTSSLGLEVSCNRICFTDSIAHTAMESLLYFNGHYKRTLANRVFCIVALGRQ